MDSDCGYPLPPAPTTAPPGSPEKMDVMAERAAQRVQLHHPRDAAEMVNVVAYDPADCWGGPRGGTVMG